MFIPLHHKKSERVFFLPAGLIIMIDEVSVPDKENPRAVPLISTMVHTTIARNGQSLVFEVKESPEEVATLLNDMLHAQGRMNKPN